MYPGVYTGVYTRQDWPEVRHTSGQSCLKGDSLGKTGPGIAQPGPVLPKIRYFRQDWPEVLLISGQSCLKWSALGKTGPGGVSPGPVLPKGWFFRHDWPESATNSGQSCHESSTPSDQGFWKHYGNKEVSVQDEKKLVAPLHPDMPESWEGEV